MRKVGLRLRFRVSRCFRALDVKARGREIYRLGCKGLEGFRVEGPYGA